MMKLQLECLICLIGSLWTSDAQIYVPNARISVSAKYVDSLEEDGDGKQLDGFMEFIFPRGNGLITQPFTTNGYSSVYMTKTFKEDINFNNFILIYGQNGRKTIEIKKKDQMSIADRNIQLDIEYTVECLTNFYGNFCDNFCKPVRNCYYCTENGERNLSFPGSTCKDPCSPDKCRNDDCLNYLKTDPTFKVVCECPKARFGRFCEHYNSPSTMDVTESVTKTVTNQSLLQNVTFKSAAELVQAFKDIQTDKYPSDIVSIIALAFGVLSTTLLIIFLLNKKCKKTKIQFDSGSDTRIPDSSLLSEESNV